MSLVLVTAPTAEPLTAAEAKARLNIGTELTDAVVDTMIKAARQMLDGPDGILGRALMTQTWDLVCDRFPYLNGYYRHRACDIEIPVPPLQEIVSVSYYDDDDALQVVDAADYIVEAGAPSFISLASGASWPSTASRRGAVVVRFIAGYGDAGEDVPEPMRAWIALQVSHQRSLTQQNLFKNREDIPGVMSVGWTVGAGAGEVIEVATRLLEQQYRVWS